MRITTGTRKRTTGVKVLSQFKIVEDTESRLVLQGKRIFGLLAAAFLGAFGGVITGVTFNFVYPPMNSSDVGSLWLGGGLGITLLLLALLFLYFALRRPDRITIDSRRGEVVFERRKDPRTVPFADITEVAVRTENRSRPRQRSIVHPVVLVTGETDELQVDASSDIEEMIRLAAKLRPVIGVPLPGNHQGE